MCQLDSCPVCGHQFIVDNWIDDKLMFLIDCQQCTTFTITKTLVELFRGSLTASERRLRIRLSCYLRNAGDDDERELTETSWFRLAEEV